MMKRHKGTFLIYVSVFAAILLTMTLMSGSGVYSDFSAQKPNYALISREKEESPVVKGLRKVLENNGTFVDLEDSKEAMMDAGFYQAVESIFVVPEEYGRKLQEGEDTALLMWQWPSSASGYYLQSAVDQYLLLVNMYRRAGGLSEEEIAEKAAASMEKEAEVKVRQYRDGAAVSDRIRLYQRFLPYSQFLLCITCVGVVFMNFRKPEIRMRNLCSPMRPFSIAFQKFLYACMVGVGAWVILNTMGAAVCWKDWQGVEPQIFFLLLANSFAMTLVAISVALLCSTLIGSENAMSFVSNVAALGMCFLSGVFVPLELMGSGILRIAKFIPVYWYEENAVMISGLADLSSESLKPVWEGMLIQAGFAVAFFCIYLVVNQHQQQAEESFGSVQTEIEL